MNIRFPIALSLILPLAACVQPTPEVRAGVPVAAQPAALRTAPRVTTTPARPQPAPDRGPVVIPDAPTYNGSNNASAPVVIDLYD